MKEFKKIIIRLSGPIAILFLWWLLYYTNVFNVSLFPSPISALSNLYVMVLNGNIFIDIRDSLLRMFIGYLSSAFLGILLGLLVGKINVLFLATEVVMDFFRSIPVTTLYPIFVLSFGIDHLSKIAMVFWSTFFVIALNTAYGVVQSNKTRLLMSQLYGANKFQIFKWVVFNDALPQTLIGLRTALSFSLIVEILCEMFMGSEYGIGQKITEAFTTYNMSELYALILLSGFIGYGLNRIFVAIEKKIVPWVYL